MATNQEPKEIREYAEGWISERIGTDAPAFLKAAFVVIGLGCTAYLLLFLYGEVNHPDRGPLVRQFNQVSQTSPGVMYVVAALALVFVASVAVFAYRKFKEH